MFSQVVQKVCASMFFLKNLSNSNNTNTVYIYWQVQGDSNLPRGPTSNNIKWSMLKTINIKIKIF